MKFVKENDNGFSVSISKKELQALGVRLEDLRYGNATTASFLREILFRARVELDFEPTDDGMRTEIIPKADGGVELVYTFSDEFEETDPRYATFSPFIQEQAYKNYYNEDDEDAFYTPTDPDTEVPFGDFSDDAGIAGLNEVMKNESASDEDRRLRVWTTSRRTSSNSIICSRKTKATQIPTRHRSRNSCAS